MAPTTKPLASSTVKSGTGLSSKGSKASFGSTISKTSSHGATAKSTSSSGSKSAKTTLLGSSSPSFPTSSKKKYETVSYNPKTGKHSTSLGIIWIPTKKRSKKKDMVYSSMNNDKRSERTPTMYSFGHMSGDSPDFQLHKKKEEEAKLVNESLKGPIATVASAGAVIVTPSDTSTESAEDKLLKHDDDSKKQDSNDKDHEYLENSDIGTKQNPESKQSKSIDKVDSVYSTTSPIKPPLQPEPTREEEDCGIKCLYYTLLCCDCVLM